MARRSLCTLLLATALTLAAVGLATLVHSASELHPSELRPFTSPTSGLRLPPTLRFKVGVRLGHLLDRLAFWLKPPIAQIADATKGYETTHALGAFARLRVAEAIEAAATASADADLLDIAARTQPPTSAEALRRLLRYLAARGFLSSSGEPGAQRFGLTDGSRLLLKDAPGSLWGMALLQAADHNDAWQNLDATLANGVETIAFNDRYGRPIFEHYYGDPTFEFAFTQFMSSVSQPANAAVAASPFSFSTACDDIVDLGGGHGSLLAEVVAAHPALSGRAVVVDLQAAVQSAPQRDGVRFVAGDAFDASTLPQAGCYLMKSVLHDWSDAKAAAILKGAARALGGAAAGGRGARLLLADIVLTAGDPMAVHKLGVDLSMMALTGGKERTDAEWAALLTACGFDVVAFHPTRSDLTLIEAKPRA